MAKAVQDNLQGYLAEKLWEMIPSIYRHEDGLAENPGVLRALVEILAEQAAVLRRSHDRLWEDQFIELCQEWAIPYLGDLVATRLLSSENTRGARVDVAKTIYYRRRKGTMRVLEELISDITGWDGVVVEEFRRVARTRHRLDPAPAPLAGRFSGTMPGGLADLRDGRAASLAGGPFDEFYHTADVRQHRGVDGRYGIPKLAFHLYRLRPYRLAGVTPFALTGGTRFTCDPSGRDIPLYMPRRRPENWDDWRSAREWELPAPISCPLLSHAEYVVAESTVQKLEDDHGLPAASAAKLRTLRGYRFPSEARLRDMLVKLDSPSLLSAGVYREILAASLVPDCGKAALLPSRQGADRWAVLTEEAPGTPVSASEAAAGDLSGWPIADPGKRLVIDPQRGRLQFYGTPPAPGSTVTYFSGFSGEIGAGSYNRPEVRTRGPALLPHISGGGAIPHHRIANDGVTQIDDSATYRDIGSKNLVQNLTLQAANQQRPYIRLTRHWVLRTPDDADAELLLDGLWLGSEGNWSVILRGDYERVVLRHCTFDPGGAQDASGSPIPHVPLVIQARIETLVVQDSILSRILTTASGVVENLVVEDSILDASDAGGIALRLPQGEVTLQRSTVFGKVDVNRLWASEALITGVVDVTDTQEGCFRFSAAPAGSRLPRPYESHVLDDVEGVFTSGQFGGPGYAQLSSTAPVELQRGAENGSEIGAFNRLLNPIRFDDLQVKVSEYMPFGLIPIFIFET